MSFQLSYLKSGNSAQGLHCSILSLWLLCLETKRVCVCVCVCGGARWVVVWGGAALGGGNWDAAWGVGL